MKKMFFCVIAIFSLVCGSLGCSQPLRTLMAVGSEQKAQQSFVKIEEARFKAVLREARAGRIKKGTARESIVARYGEPVINTESYCLYRGPVDFFNSPKVYLDFDEKGALIGTRIAEREQQEQERDVRP
ncbi:MAG: hypothetical protein V1840_03275 [Candidatus Omnitrophota bacterium]